MKKLIIILFCLFSLDTLTYSSFPIAESPTEKLLESKTEVSVSDHFLEFSWWSELHWIFQALIFLIALTVAFIALWASFVFIMATITIIRFFEDN
tara:strand:+ start:948 stop:1232 length:285 start_codon:yes stop_codon:yes gene_type:complete